MSDYRDISEECRSSYYFLGDPGGVFQHVGSGEMPVWEILDHLPAVLTGFFTDDMDRVPLPRAFQPMEWINREGSRETVLYMREGFKADSDSIFSGNLLAVGKGSVIEPGALIKPPALIGRDTEIRHAAYIRGGALIGDHCTVGHATELKTAIFMDHSEAGHFAYVGDSVLGSHVNLGAGTRLANLPFRTLDQKRDNEFPVFDIRIKGARIRTGKSKFGAILGDGVETGCNSTLAPGILVGPDSWIYPCTFVKAGFYPAKTIVKSGSRASVDLRR
ncbi:MAG TPA: hypothetical protein PLV45_16610 [bacterium]|nr:hypothetical protein [bacterium]